MKVRLLDPDSDISLEPWMSPRLADMVEEDLELLTLYKAMANGDEFLYRVAKNVVPLGVANPVIIEYRQHVLADVMANTPVVQQMYEIAVDAVEVRKKVFLGGMLFRDPTAMVHSAVQILEFLAEDVKQLRQLCDQTAGQFGSDGFRQFVGMVTEELSDDYLVQLDEHLSELMLPRGVLLSAQLGLGNKGGRLVLHQPPQRRSLWDKLTGNHNSGYGFEIDPRDQAGSQAINDLAGRALNDVANILTQSVDHVKGFFERLRTELGFYLGCVNLHARLTKSGVPTCFPTAAVVVPAELRCRDLRDVGLCLTTAKPVTGNDVDADGKSLIMVTGANEGGKSTFLRSVGTAQTMMQAGMFVTAKAFHANVTRGLFTHFKREEDATMTSGKLDEELARMSEIADCIGWKSLLLCNESFASTNEREGSQIARGVIDAFIEAGIKVVYVTHLYDLAHSLHTRHDTDHLFLRAERRDDGVRTFRLISAEPEPTSYGEDSFLRIFGTPVGAEAGGR
jgi:MutS domain V